MTVALGGTPEGNEIGKALVVVMIALVVVGFLKVVLGRRKK